MMLRGLGDNRETYFFIFSCREINSLFFGTRTKIFGSKFKKLYPFKNNSVIIIRKKSDFWNFFSHSKIELQWIIFIFYES